MIARCLVAIALLIPACAAAEDFAAKAAAHIVRIVVAGPQDPDHVAIRDPDEANAIASGLGAALASGGGAGAGEMAAKSDATVGLTDFDAVLRDRNVKLGAEMKSAVAMQRDGYTIQNEPSYNTDAALNLSIDKIWYNAGPFRSKLTPEIIVHARFIDMNSHEILFDKDYHFANPDAVDFGTPIPAPAKFSFANYDAVLANPDAAIAGLRAAIPLIAAAIGNDLKK